MIDIKLIRENPGIVRQNLEKRCEDTAQLDRILEIDGRYLAMQRDVEQLRARRNEVSKQISKMKDKPQDLIAEMRQVGDRISELEAQANACQAELEDKLLRMPNMVRPDVPAGTGAEDNVVSRLEGKQRDFSFEAKPHWDLAEKLDIIDFARGVRLSGTRFYVLKGLGARLQRAIIQFMLDTHVKEHGYTEIYPPFMVKRECLVGSSNLPKFADNLYHDAEEDLWWVPTAEVPLTNMHRDEILAVESLPIHYVAYTACFRREKMAAGKDTRGIKRGHQFDKVELYKFCEPEKSTAELESLRSDAEDICKKLGLPYRVLTLCTGDLGFASAKSYDLEMWAPGCQEWLEVSSCSVCDEFQARRANVRYRPEANAKPRFVCTLNGSGLALPRVVISILENYQQADGSITIPEVLRPYMGVDVIK
jgi:seryl-tRNA synthetase